MMIEPTVIIGNANLYLGDCREILPTFPAMDAVVTDPPYGTKVTEWDEPVDDETVRLILEKSTGYSALFYSNTRLATLLTTIRDSGRDAWVAVWHKPNAMGFERRFAPQWVPIAIAYNGKLPFWGKDYCSCPIVPQDIDHPTPKPLGITKWLIERCSLPNYTILDPFMGSGTTGVAAVQMGRYFVGIERDQKHFETACERIREAQRQGDMFIGEAA